MRQKQRHYWSSNCLTMWCLEKWWRRYCKESISHCSKIHAVPAPLSNNIHGKWREKHKRWLKRVLQNSRAIPILFSFCLGRDNHRFTMTGVLNEWEAANKRGWYQYTLMENIFCTKRSGDERDDFGRKISRRFCKTIHKGMRFEK